MPRDAKEIEAEQKLIYRPKPRLAAVPAPVLSSSKSTTATKRKRRANRREPDSSEPVKLKPENRTERESMTSESTAPEPESTATQNNSPNSPQQQQSAAGSEPPSNGTTTVAAGGADDGKSESKTGETTGRKKKRPKPGPIVNTPLTPEEINAIPALLDYVLKIGKDIYDAKVLNCSNMAQARLYALHTIVNRCSVHDLKRDYWPMLGGLSMKYDAMLGRFNRAGGEHKVLDRTAQRACIELSTGKGRGKQTHEFSLTWDEALNEPFVWAKGAGGPRLPKFITANDGVTVIPNPVALKEKYSTERGRMQMLFARVVSDGIRVMMPSVNSGYYTPEELEDVAQDHPQSFPQPEPDSQTAGSDSVPEATATAATSTTSPDAVEPQGNGNGSSTGGESSAPPTTTPEPPPAATAQTTAAPAVSAATHPEPETTQSPQPQPQQTESQTVVASGPSPEQQPAENTQAPEINTANVRGVNDEQMAEIASLVPRTFNFNNDTPVDAWKAKYKAVLMKNYSVGTARELTFDQAEGFIANMKARIRSLEETQHRNDWANGAVKQNLASGTAAVAATAGN